MSTLTYFGVPGDFFGAVRRGDIAREDAMNLLAGRVLPALRYRLVLRQFFWCCLTGKQWLYGQYQRMVHRDGYLDQELDALSNSSRKIKPPMGPTLFATTAAAGQIRALGPLAPLSQF